MVFQHFNLFPHLTVLENLTLAPIWVRGMPKTRGRGEGDAATWSACASRSRRTNIRASSPAASSSAWRSPGRLHEAEIMLFDEPTSALDPEMVKEVLDVMIELADEGMTMMCVTHEMGFARRSPTAWSSWTRARSSSRRRPQEFFANPAHDRTKLFLSQILAH